MAPPRVRDVSATYLVSDAVHGPDVAALAWSGRSGDQRGGGAHVVLRVHIHRDEQYAGWTVSQEEGDATRCFQLTIRTWRYDDTSEVQEVGCPSGPVPPRPTGVEPEALPQDVDALLSRALTGSASADGARAALRAALPHYATVDVVVWHGGLVAAVGAPAVQDCAVAVRNDRGRVRVLSVDRTQVQPGEIGCRAQLVTDPARGGQ